MENVRVTIDTKLCIGSRWCERSAPASFNVDDEGVAHVVEPPSDALDDLVDAALNCPSGAIRVIDADTGADLTAEA